MKIKINCKDCCYYWYNEEYEREMCNYTGINNFAPCEQEEYDEYQEEYDEY